jgi:hypothetical protein
MSSGAGCRPHLMHDPVNRPMHRMVFVNLPVADVARARAFFADLDFSFNEQYCDEKAACLVLNDLAFVMLLEREFFATFTPRPVADATTASEILLAVSAPSRECVDRFVDAAVTAGGREVRPPYDEGFMYHRSIADLDGHIWEVLWMAPPEADRVDAANGVATAREA